MRVFKTRSFGRFQRGERISDAALAKAVRAIETGLVDADLGGGLVKQRIARPGQGKSGGYRTVIAYRRGDRAVFLFGFAKNDKDNVDASTLDNLREAGRELLGFDGHDMQAAVAAERLMEVPYGRQDQAQADHRRAHANRNR